MIDGSGRSLVDGTLEEGVRDTKAVALQLETSINVRSIIVWRDILLVCLRMGCICAGSFVVCL